MTLVRTIKIYLLNKTFINRPNKNTFSTQISDELVVLQNTSRPEIGAAKIFTNITRIFIICRCLVKRETCPQYNSLLAATGTSNVNTGDMQKLFLACF